MVSLSILTCTAFNYIVPLNKVVVCNSSICTKQSTSHRVRVTTINQEPIEHLFS